jgi:hypothetical protein
LPIESSELGYQSEVLRVFRLNGEAVAGDRHRNYGVISQSGSADKIESVFLPDFAEHMTGARPVTPDGNEQPANIGKLTFHALEAAARFCVCSTDIKLFQYDDAEPQWMYLPVAGTQSSAQSQNCSIALSQGCNINRCVEQDARQMLFLLPAKSAKHVLDSPATLDETFRSRPGAPLALTFGNHLLKRAFDGLGFGFRAEQFLRSFDLDLVEGVVLVLDR